MRMFLNRWIVRFKFKHMSLAKYCAAILCQDNSESTDSKISVYDVCHMLNIM